jgi:protein-S-isoprenylcysteine O-methyltransferase Ste14
MRAYLVTTGVLFGLITCAHLLRIVVEWPHLATDPGYLLITVAAAILCIWAWRLFRRSTRPEP